MKTLYRFIVCSFMLVLFAGCVKDEVVLDDIQYELTARMEMDASTRTSLSGLQGDMYYPLWSAGDELAVFVDGETSPSKFTLKSGEGATKATFAGTREGSYYYALYPFSDTTRMENGVIHFTLPSVQEYVAGSFGIGSYPMVAYGASETLNFKNLCAVMKISITGDAAVRSITLQSKDEEAYLSGRVKVNFNDDSSLQLQILEGGANSVTLDCKGTELAKDSVTDFHFVIPAQSYKGGFDVIIDAYTDTIVKSVASDLEFKRSSMRHLKGMELNYEMDDHQKQLAKEKAALIAIYQALDGDNWTNNENWCSDKPVNEWYGINTDYNGYVFYLQLAGNNLSGDVPKEIGHLKYLEYINLQANNKIKSLPEEIGNLDHLVDFNFDSPECDIPDTIYNLENIKALRLASVDMDKVFVNKNLEILYANANGEIPSSIGNCTSLKELSLYGNLGGVIPSEIGNCVNLEYLSLNNCNLSGAIPNELGNCVNLQILMLENNNLTGYIPGSLGNCSSLRDIRLNDNMLVGTIPQEVALLPSLKYMTLYFNNLSGEIPQGLLSNEYLWKYSWAYILNGNNLSIDNIEIKAPSFNVKDLKGNDINSDDLYSSNKYTLLCQISSYFAGYQDFTELKRIYSDFSNYGFKVVLYTAKKGLWIDSKEDINNYINNNNLEWTTIYWDEENVLMDVPDDWSYSNYYPYHVFPAYTLVDSVGKVVYYKYDGHLDGSLSSLSAFLMKNIRGVEYDYYVSTDYTQDGTTVQLQKAAEGNGINIVLMGDGYSDRQIADGSYKADMEYVYSNLFTKEPYKSYKHLFNVSYVNVVSATEGFEYGNTALSCGFGDGTYVYGNDNAVFKYAQKVVDASAIDETLMIVVMNSNNYAGTCFMYYPNSSGTDYGKGPAVAYFPKGESSEVFAQLLHHEANGHGFAKLADEYAYDYMGTIPSEEVENTKNQQSLYGWWKNVDFTNDPAQVRWKQFLEDSRYANEGLGVFEGGLTYWSGVWRPTENSIMRYNQGEFNAPSREAIYYRMHKLAYGADWKYDYEKFVEYDAVNYNAQAAPATKVSPLRPKQQLHPPVVIKKSWREAE